MFVRSVYRCVCFCCHVYTDGESRGHIGAPVQTVVPVRFIFLRHRVQKLRLQPAGQVPSRFPLFTRLFTAETQLAEHPDFMALTVFWCVFMI